MNEDLFSNCLRFQALTPTHHIKALTKIRHIPENKQKISGFPNRGQYFHYIILPQISSALLTYQCAGQFDQ